MWQDDLLTFSGVLRNLFENSILLSAFSFLRAIARITISLCVLSSITLANTCVCLFAAIVYVYLCISCFLLQNGGRLPRPDHAADAAAVVAAAKAIAATTAGCDALNETVIAELARGSSASIGTRVLWVCVGNVGVFDFALVCGGCLSVWVCLCVFFSCVAQECGCTVGCAVGG
jgi:hypothetical protein